MKEVNRSSNKTGAKQQTAKNVQGTSNSSGQNSTQNSSQNSSQNKSVENADRKKR